MAYLRRFWVKEPRHSENVIARKRYTLIWRIFGDFGSREPCHSKTVIARKRYTLTWRIYDDFGLRSPVIQKTFSPKNGIPNDDVRVARGTVRQKIRPGAGFEAGDSIEV